MDNTRKVGPYEKKLLARFIATEAIQTGKPPQDSVLKFIQDKEHRNAAIKKAKETMEHYMKQLEEQHEMEGAEFNPEAICKYILDEVDKRNNNIIRRKLNNG